MAFSFHGVGGDLWGGLLTGDDYSTGVDKPPQRSLYVFRDASIAGEYGWYYFSPLHLVNRAIKFVDSTESVRGQYGVRKDDGPDLQPEDERYRGGAVL